MNDLAPLDVVIDPPSESECDVNSASTSESEADQKENPKRTKDFSALLFPGSLFTIKFD